MESTGSAMEEKITVKEIARLAGVSIGTVDRVLHDRGGVSARTTESIRGIISSLGWEPDLVARQLSLKKNYTFRVIMPRAEQDSGYWALCLQGIKRAEHDLAPYRCVVRVDEFDRYDQAAYRRLLDGVVEESCDGLLFAPAMPEALGPALARLDNRDEGGKVDAPVPYVFFDGYLEGASPMAVVAQDPFRGGYLAGRVMSLLSPGPGRLVALSAHAEDKHIARRIDGFRAFFRDHDPTRRIDAAACPGLDGTCAGEGVLEGVFGDAAGIGGILVANSSGHLVGDWLAGRRLEPAPALVSWDAVPDNVRALREGSIDCLVSQRPAEQAREALELLFHAVVRGAGSLASRRTAEIPLELFFRENLPAGGMD
jgi:LacI family transcriptional regulator